MSRLDQFSFDDRCFLFLNFKIEISLFHQLPIELAPGISLASTPQHALAQTAGRGSTERENIALAEWVYPSFGLGTGIVNACIKIDSSVPADLRNRYFLFMVSALYLTKPLYINTSLEKKNKDPALGTPLPKHGQASACIRKDLECMVLILKRRNK